MRVGRIAGYVPGCAALVLASIAWLLFLLPSVTLSQEKHPAYLTPPGNEYPQPAHGAQPPIIYNPYEYDFESREALELEKDEPAAETDEEKEEDHEEFKPDESKLPKSLPTHYWTVEEPDSDKPQGGKTPFPSDPQELGKGSWVRP